MKTYRIESTWRAVTEVEVEDDVVVDPSDLHSWPQDVLEQVTTQGAELIDWDVAGGAMDTSDPYEGQRVFFDEPSRPVDHSCTGGRISRRSST